MRRNFYIEMVVTMMLIGASFVLGLMLKDNPISISDGHGLPVSNVELSRDGLVLTFDLAESHLQANLVRAYDRPPNLETATKLYADGDRLLFTSDEGDRLIVFQYTAPLVQRELP